MAGDGRRRVAELTRLVTASPSLMARERQIVARYTDALAALLAEETGAGPDDIEPRLAAEAMMAFHRSLVDFARRRALSRKSSADLAAEIRAAGERALELLEPASAITEDTPRSRGRTLNPQIRGAFRVGPDARRPRRIHSPDMEEVMQTSTARTEPDARRR